MHLPNLRKAGNRRVLFITVYPEEIASTRFRVTQYFPYLEEHGIRCTLSPLMTPAFCRDFYRKGSLFKKGLKLCWLSLRRLFDVFRAFRYDAVFVQRESHIIGPPVIEWLISRVLRKPLIFDFDDAIFLPSHGSIYPAWTRLLKCSWKISRIIKLSDCVIVSTEYNRRYALRYSRNVVLMPTVVDADKFLPAAKRNGRIPVIGWIGSFSGAGYISDLSDVFEALWKKYAFILKLVGLERDYPLQGPNVLNQAFELSREIEDFQSLDIGVYPVTDEPWSHGKPGFKVVQYMAVGIPSVSSPVGGVLDFVSEGVNGMFAADKREWIAKLSLLLEDDELRRRMGTAARCTVEESYCLQQQAPRLLAVLKASVEKEQLHLLRFLARIGKQP